MNIRFLGLFAGLLLTSCASTVPYTDELKKEFDLQDERKIKQVQFYVSNEIIMYRSYDSGSKGTQYDGALVQNSQSKQDRIIIPPSTKCIFEKFGDNGEVYIRFEPGNGRTLKFVVRPNYSGRYYLQSDWKDGKGSVVYENRTYQAVSPSASAFLMVRMKKMQETDRRDRIVRGMKVK